jgi:hypothetical protein
VVFKINTCKWKVEVEKLASAKPHNTHFIKISSAVSATHIKNNNILESLTGRGVGRDSSVGIAIR